MMILRAKPKRDATTAIGKREKTQRWPTEPLQSHKMAAICLAMLLAAGECFGLGILVPRPPESAPIEPREAQVRVQIKEDLAVTRVLQIFYNPNPTRQEADFYFPVPHGANVTDFVLYMDGKPVRGEILEREKARNIYEDIVRRMRDPGLLEWMESDIFRVRVFPVPARGTQKIEIEFSGPLQAHAGTFRYLLPLHVPSSRLAKSAEFAGGLSEFRIELIGDRDFGNIYSPTHEVKIARENAKSIVVEPSETARFDTSHSFELYYDYREKDFALSLMGTRTPDAPGFFCAMVSPPSEKHKATTYPLDLTLVVDTSGSMAESGKIEQAKKALLYCLTQLRLHDRFHLIRFATDIEEFNDGLEEATPLAIEKAKAWVEGLHARGGTNIAAALERALSPTDAITSTADRLHVIIFVTDGCPTVGETNPDRILELVGRVNGHKAVPLSKPDGEKLQSRLRVFTFGVGNDVNTRLLDRLAERTRAFSEYVRPEQDLEVPVSRLFDRASRPALTNIQITFSPHVIFDVYPKELPDLFYGDQLTLFGRYKKGGSLLITLKGMVAGNVVEYTFERSLPENTSENRFVEKLWATRKIGYLLDELRERGDNAEIRDEVIALSKKYGIVTPLTSFLVAEDVPPPEAAHQPLPRRETRPHAPITLGATDRIAPAPGKGVALRSAGSRFAETGEVAVKQARELQALKRQVVATPDSVQSVRTVQNKTFVLRNGVWRDQEIETHVNLRRIAIQPFSDAYFELLRRIPELADYFALGERVEIAVHGVLLATTPEGKTMLNADDRQQLGI